MQALERSYVKGRRSDTSFTEMSPSDRIPRFNLTFAKGRAGLALHDYPLPYGMIETLELTIPEVSYPFDVSGGPQQFRHHHCQLHHLAVTISTQELQRLVAEIETNSTSLSNFTGVWKQGELQLSGCYTVADISCYFFYRIGLVLRDQTTLVWVIFEQRILGTANISPNYFEQELAQQLVTNLLGGQLKFERPGCWRMDSPHVGLRDLLAGAGWKAPDCKSAKYSDVSITPYGCKIVFERPAENLLSKRATMHVEALKADIAREEFQEIEQAIVDGNILMGFEKYHGIFHSGPHRHWAAKRLLELGVTETVLHQETKALALQLLMTGELYLESQIALALIAWRRDEFETASTHLSMVVKWCVSQDNLGGLALISQLAHVQVLQHYDITRAISLLQDLAPRSSGACQIYRQLFDLLQKENKLTKALEVAEHLVRLLGDRNEKISVLLAAAEIALQLGDKNQDYRNQARILFTRALDLDDGNMDALNGIAEIFIASGEPLRGIGYMEELIVVAMNKNALVRAVRLHLRLAELWENSLKQTENSKAHLLAALEINADCVAAYLGLAELFIREGDQQRGRHFYERLLLRDLNERDKEPLLLSKAASSLAQLCRHLGDAEDADRWMERAIQLDPNHLI